MEYDGATNFSNGLARVAKKDAGGGGKCGFIDITGKLVVLLEYDSAGFVSGGENDTVKLCWVYKDGIFGIFANPNYASLAGPTAPEPGNTEEPGGESPAPGSQNTQSPTTSGGNGNTTDNGGGFPVVPVVVGAVGVAAVGTAAAVFVRKKK